MHQRTYPQLSKIQEYGTAGGGALGAMSALTDAPDSASLACYIKVVDTTTGTALSIVCASGDTNTITVVDNAEYRIDFVGLGAATTCDCVQIGWD